MLRPRKAGRITGEVRGRQGEFLSGVWVYAPGAEPASSDSDGRFELSGLLPGEVQVTATNADTGLLLSAQATVVAGETTHVLLQIPESFVRMHGRVWIAGDPVAGVTVRSQLREPKQDGPWCTSAEDGSYALDLPGPGAYWIGVWDTERGTHLWLAVDVPHRAEFAQDLGLPAGRVAGRVRAQDGTPLANVTVWAQQTSDTTGARGWGSTTTDERGEYELVLPAAVYEIVAGGDGGDADPSRSFARATVPGIAVVNRSHLRGIDFELAEGGTLEGLVRWGDGSSAADAELWIGPQGKVAESSSLGQTDARGRFRIEGVGAGKYVVTATQGQGTAEWQKVEVQPGSVHALELPLAATEWLVVRVLDRGGTALAAEVEVFDAKQKRFGSLPEEGPSARLGPLPAGNYQVRARLGERTASAEVTLTGKQETRTLEIVLP